MLPTATRAVAFLTFPSVKVKGNVYLFVLLGASLMIFCCDVFLLRSTTTQQTQSDLRRSLYAQPITRPTTKRQKHIGSSSTVDRKKHSRRLERNSSHGSKQQTMPPSAGAFVHIGKTGGSTISKLLRNGCHAVYPKPCRNITDETIVSKLVDYYHGMKCALLRLFCSPCQIGAASSSRYTDSSRLLEVAYLESQVLYRFRPRPL